MAEQKKFYWLKLPCDFFERTDIILLEKAFPNGTSMLLCYIRLLVVSAPDYGVISKDPKQLQNLIGVDSNKIRKTLPILERFGLIVPIDSNHYQLKDSGVSRVWTCKESSGRDRNSRDYKEWRLAVFERDNFTCQICHKSGCQLEAHHIERWVDNISRRYDVTNGITLCKECHKEVHRGEIKNVRTQNVCKNNN